jgi:hypothetical protein
MSFRSPAQGLVQLSSLVLIVAGAAWDASAQLPCSEAALRASAATGGVYRFTCDRAINFSSSIVVSNAWTVEANGHNVSISGQNSTTLFTVNTNAVFTVSGLRLINGVAAVAGGCLFINRGGEVRLTRCELSGHQALGNYSGENSVRMLPSGYKGWNLCAGGAICNLGTLRIEDCVFAGNYGRGISLGSPAYGAALFNVGVAHLSGSLFSENRALAAGSQPLTGGGYPAQGGAICAGYDNSTPFGLYITNCTFNTNLAQASLNVSGVSRGEAYGGAVYAGATSAFCINSTFLGNQLITSDSGGGSALGGGIVAKNCLVVAPTNPSVSWPSNLVFNPDRNLVGGQELLVGPLTNNGGPTPAAALSAFSPAIDAGSAATCPSSDARGVARPIGNGCDIGAFEYDGGVRKPILTASFLPSAVGVDVISRFTVSIQNTGVVALTNGTLSVTFPSNVVIASVPAPGASCSGNVVATPGSSQWRFESFYLPGAQTCDVSVNARSGLVGTWSGVIHALAVPNAGSLSVTQSISLIVTSSPPLVETLPARDIQPTSARIQGTLNANGVVSVAQFRWGPAGGLLVNRTPAMSSGGTAAIEINAVITNLNPGFSYDYQLTASNQFGVTTGAVLRFVASDGVVSVCNEGNLRTALTTYHRVRMDCGGVILLTAPLVISGDTIFEGGGVVLSGNNTSQVLRVDAAAKLTVFHTTIAYGRSAQGGGLHNEGVLCLSNCVVRNNSASQGAGVFNRGQLWLIDCRLENNLGLGTNGAPGANGRDAICYYDEFLRCRTAIGNMFGLPGEAGYPGRGGGLFNEGTATAIRATIRSNVVVGGDGGAGGSSGSSGCCGNSFSFGGCGGAGGDSLGAGIFNGGGLLLSNSFVGLNRGTGGRGGRGGATGTSLGGPGCGGAGGAGQGAGLWNTGSNLVVNTTFAENLSEGGSGAGVGERPLSPCFLSGDGRGGNGMGGALFNQASLTLINATIWNNHAIGGVGGAHTNTQCPSPPGNGVVRGPDGLGTATSVASSTGNVWIINTILGTSGSVSNVVGQITDLGHNICSDETAALTGPGSLNMTDPRLAALAGNGGPTATMALLPGSPALEAADSAVCPPTDQRGAPRPIGRGCDIGAHEASWLRLQQLSGGRIQLELVTIPGQTASLYSSPNLVNWTLEQSIVAGADGLAIFPPRSATNPPSLFFRASPP